MFQVDSDPTNGRITYIIHSKVHSGIICIVLIIKNTSGLVSSQITDCADEDQDESGCSLLLRSGRSKITDSTVRHEHVTEYYE